MRNAVKIDSQLVVTVDNSGCIGMKEHDVVQVPNEIAAYYSTRVVLLEQWAAGAKPTHLFLTNFTSEEAWIDYEKGIKRAFTEIGEKTPPINGSTESNFSSLQSGLSLMMVGKIVQEDQTDMCDWYVIGKPLVGEEVVKQPENVAQLNELALLMKLGIIKRLWPTGSKGLQVEFDRLFNGQQTQCSLSMNVTCGPSTAVIVGIDRTEVNRFEEIVTTSYEKITIS